jgi:hypothetical protein
MTSWGVVYLTIGCAGALFTFGKVSQMLNHLRWIWCVKYRTSGNKSISACLASNLNRLERYSTIDL